MAQKSEKGRYLELSDVRVSYDARYDLISVTSADPELKDRGGLKFSVGSKSKGYDALRSLLEEKGLIYENSWEILTRRESHNLLKLNAGSRPLVVGTDISKNPLFWDPALSPITIAGDIYRVGEDVNDAYTALLNQSLSRGWRNIVLDPYGNSLYMPLEDARAVIDDIDQIAAALRDVLAIVQKRFAYLDLLSELGRLEHYDINQQFFEPLLVTVANIHDLALIIEEDGQDRNIPAMLAELASYGGKVAVYSAIGFHGEFGSALGSICKLSTDLEGFEDLLSVMDRGVRLTMGEKLQNRRRGRISKGDAAGQTFQTLDLGGFNVRESIDQNWSVVRAELQLEIERKTQKVHRQLNAPSRLVVPLSEILPAPEPVQPKNFKPAEEEVDYSLEPKRFQEIYDEEAMLARRRRRSRQRSSEVRFA